MAAPPPSGFTEMNWGEAWGGSEPSRYWWHAWWFIAHTVVRGGLDKVHVGLEIRPAPA